MALKASVTPLVITLTQGAADGFIQGSVLTGLSGNQAYNLLGIAWEWQGAISAINQSEILATLSRRSKTALPLLSDTDVIAGFGWMLQAGAASQFTRDRFGYWKPEVEIPIVEETIYAQLDSTLTGIVNTMILRLDVEIDTMSPIDRLNLITRSLT